VASEQFNRPRAGLRYAGIGLRTTDVADALPPNRSPYLQNVRTTRDSNLQTRPGQTLSFALTGDTAHYIADLRAYSALGTDNLPRVVAYAVDGRVWLDSGAGVVGSLAITSATPLGASLIPFRPNQSPVPYLYIANGTDYQKFSAPSPAVTQQKVGIAEPQSPPDAALDSLAIGQFTFTGTYTHGGTATGVTGGSRVSDIAGTVLPDPTPGSAVWSIQVSSSISYQKLMQVAIGPTVFVIQDVIPPLATALAISAIAYFTGTTGRCIIVPANLSAGPGSEESSIYTQNILASLRRGALISVGAEVCIVWSVTIGPDGSVAIETSTTGTHTIADSLTSLPTVTVVGGSPTAGQGIAAAQVSYQVASGVGTQTATLNTNPFVTSGGTAFQPDDLISVGILLNVALDNIQTLTEVKLLIDIDDGSFTKNFYYYAIRASDIAQALAPTNPQTQLAVAQTVDQRATVDEEAAAAANNQLATASSAQLVPGTDQWTQIVFPISALTRVGGDQTKSLQNAVKIQFLWNCTGTINVATDNVVTVFGTNQPDVGDVGAPYQYRVRPRSSVTGAVGNPSPETRYGVSARRTSVLVALPSAAYDAQIDTWDVFRYGGSVNSWRQIGSTPSSNTSFVDNFDDAAATAGDALDFDNFEPWPSVDIPLNATTISVTGTIALVTIAAPTNALRFLPGNLVQLGGQNVVTLRSRPVLISGTTYRFEFEENAGALGAVSVQIYEPALARQFLPYMFGPDASGTVLAVGDPLRPGTLYFAKPSQPDSAPDSYNIEITPPSEPLLGGVIVDGLAFVASPERWWALYPQFGNAAQRYSVVQQPALRGLAAPRGLATDGVSFYYWAKDGIYSSTKGLLTADLYNLFPHDGVPGVNVTYNGRTVFAPDYRYAQQFRLTFSNGYLYAIYADQTQTFRCLVYDALRAAWTLDVYTPPVSACYHPEQQAGTLLDTATPTRYPELLMATMPFVSHTPQSAAVVVQTDLSDDYAGQIACIVDSAEASAGDDRAPKQWGDLFVDVTPVAAGAALTAQPMSLGAAAAPAVVVPATTLRTRTPVSVGGIVLSAYLGLELTWTDKYSGGGQTAPTRLHLWQPSFAIQPAATVAWATIGSNFGCEGYFHIRQLVLAYISSAAITLTLTPFDGQAPAVVTLPSSSGVLVKRFFPLTANKGLLYAVAAASSAPFQLYLDDSEIAVGPWARTGPYVIARDFGGRTVENAAI